MNAAILTAVTIGLVAWVISPILRRPAGSSAPDGPPRCVNCGPRPEGDARFCSNCGAPTTR
jgi:hypothetical protein